MGLFKNLWGNRGAPEKTAARERTKEESSYSGVQIRSDSSNCCGAAKALADKRFLSKNVPMLPLADCDAVDCRCTYQRFDDRRTDSRRTSDEVFDVISEFHKDDHRSSHTAGRRSKD